jgi:hypothetical protein
MDKPEFKSRWWLPILMLFVPGSCYLYAAFIPSFRVDFAILGAIIVSGVVLLAAWRVFDARGTNTHTYRSIVCHGYTFAALLISFRFWAAAFSFLSFPVGIALLIVYATTWLLPSFAPSIAEVFYRELFFPKNRFMRILVKATLALGGGAGALGASIGKGFANFGNFGLLIMALIVSLALVIGDLYVSTALWRQQHNLNSVPSVKD